MITFFQNINEQISFRKKILIVVCLIVIPVLVLEIWSVNRLATYGVQISELERSKDRLKLENQILENKIAEKSSLTIIGSMAKKYGYTKVKNIEYFKLSGLALSNALPNY